MNGRLLALATFTSFPFLIGCCRNANIGCCWNADPPEAPLVQVASCSGTRSTLLPNYDRLSDKFLDEDTRHPSDNLNGKVDVGTRSYLESLLTAYEATANPKYVQAFLDSAAWTLNLVQRLRVLNVPDPSAPGRTGPLLSVMGWPTVVGSFSVPVAVPTQTGQQVALYVQSFDTTSGTGAMQFVVTQRSDGSLGLDWQAPQRILKTDVVRTIADLNAVASQPLVENPDRSSPGRIIPTGLGLPAPGKYLMGAPVQTNWHQQTGTILLPFAHFLLLAKENRGIADETTQKEWTSQVLAIAAGYEDEFVPDGNGGLQFHNPVWLPNRIADLDAATDYISAEATLRVFLYKLTGDAHELSIAKGLTLHQRIFHWSVNPQGWLLLQFWPDFVSWSSRAEGPAGNILDSYKFDPKTPAPVTDGAFFVDFLHYAKVLGLTRDLGITDCIYCANREAFQQYIYASNSSSNTSNPLLRASYPAVNSMSSDPIVPTQDLYAGAGFLTPEVADQSFINANWNWMLIYGQDLHGSIGYFLRAWARSEAAELNACNFAKGAAR